MSKTLLNKRSKIDLADVTLITVTGVNYEKAQFALKRSSRKINFAKIVLVGAEKPRNLREGIEFELAYSNKLDSIDQYSKYCIYDLWRHVETKFALVIQADGYVINPNAWNPNYLKFDYIGAPWAVSDKSYIDPFGNHIRVGNGGFSLRSSKLLQVPLSENIPWEVNDGNFYKHMNYNLYSEDGNICVHNRHLYESQGCEFAPLAVALEFSIEKKVPEFANKKTFGFHKRLPTLTIRVKEYFAWVLFRLKNLK